MSTDKELRELIKEIKNANANNPTEDLAESKELKELSKELHSRHDATEANTKQLKEDADANKNFNKIQIYKIKICSVSLLCVLAIPAVCESAENAESQENSHA